MNKLLQALARLLKDEHNGLEETQALLDLPTLAPAPISLQPEPDPQVWDATVQVDGQSIRTYPVTTQGALTGYYVDSGEKFTGRLWAGNGFIWMRIDKATRPEIIGRWVAVQMAHGPQRFITLTRLTAWTPRYKWEDDEA